MTTTHDIFGNAEGAQPATPGSYGVPPSGYRLPAATRLGPVRLQVADLSRSLTWYEGRLGLRVLERDTASALLGAEGGRSLVELRERARVKPVPPAGRTGLYHFAILLPDRASLGRLLRHLEGTGERVGRSDHLVSQSLYLHDPDNLGIEVYVDRPRETWRRIGRELMMATDPLDVDGLMREAGSVQWSGLPDGTVMGHVHLRVGDLAGASSFYSDALGFDRMVWKYPGALFLAAGGYHHHLGTNTWAGQDATPPPADEAQLLGWTIELPDRAALDAVRESLVKTGFQAELESESGSLITHDPWRTQIRLELAASSQ
jgi:catechol 2,3-dioxygenase